jgi:hypothetical protein
MYHCSQTVVSEQDQSPGFFNQAPTSCIIFMKNKIDKEWILNVIQDDNKEIEEERRFRF